MFRLILSAVGLLHNPSPPPSPRLPFGDTIAKQQMDWSVVGAAALDIECAALAATRDNIGEDFPAPIRLFLNLSGKIICMGVGKSGHIAAKPLPLFLPPAHRPFLFTNRSRTRRFGFGKRRGCVLVISYSGESGEILSLLSAFRPITNTACRHCRAATIHFGGGFRYLSVIGRLKRKLARTIWRPPPAQPWLWPWPIPWP